MKSPHLCPTPYCRRKRRKKGTLCARCQKRQWRADNPMKARCARLKQRAEEKKVPFDLTPEWLSTFLAENHYDPTLHHIDRIKTWLGYTMGNLQVLDSTENIAKGNRERRGQLELEPF